MPKRKAHEYQLDVRRHINAAERQRLADWLKERIKDIEKRMPTCQDLINGEQRLIKQAASWWEEVQHKLELRQLKRRQRALMDEIDYLQWRRLKLGGHRIFRLPVVAGYGMGDALRRERAKEAR